MTVGARNYNSLSLTSGTSDWIIVDPFVHPFNISVSIILSAGATINFTAQYTIEPLANEQDVSGTAIDLPDLVGGTVTISKAVIAPVRGVRLKINSGTGTATLIVRQAGVPGVAT